MQVEVTPKLGRAKTPNVEAVFSVLFEQVLLYRSSVTLSSDQINQCDMFSTLDDRIDLDETAVSFRLQATYCRRNWGRPHPHLDSKVDAQVHVNDLMGSHTGMLASKH